VAGIATFYRLTAAVQGLAEHFESPRRTYEREDAKARRREEEKDRNGFSDFS
jgi:hypothetical protein